MDVLKNEIYIFHKIYKIHNGECSREFIFVYIL
jgi:hypothetical protein